MGQASTQPDGDETGAGRRANAPSAAGDLPGIFLAHVASGVADANGKLLLRWDGAQWRALR